MKILIKTGMWVLFAAMNIFCAAPVTFIIAKGQQPQITIDDAGIIRIIYGDGDKIYCATSVDNGITFPAIRLVGEVKNMHLGMARGPQMASSKNYTIVTAIDKKGSVHIFQLSHQSSKWIETSLANDEAGTAPEGLMSIAADQADNFYAVWLDNRLDKNNKICYAKTTDKGFTWSKNKMVYISPDKTVCECCKPGIAVSKSHIVIMFRNWLKGSRDLYLLQSYNKGKKFYEVEKLGTGTWKLNGCPMDGGGVTISEKQDVTTVWQRQGSIYYSKPTKIESKIGVGRNCSITSSDNPVFTWQEGNKLKLKELSKPVFEDVGEGSFLKTIRTKDNHILCTWEKEGQIVFKIL